tara:strand:- start:155 stop:1030 length:876 start_codon:yes stop_codon:yes gene_type:complete
MDKLFTIKFGSRLVSFGIIFFFLGLIFFLWNDWHISLDSSVNSEKAAQFGDFIGGIVGSFWALAGVILFYVALIEQRKDFLTNSKVLDAQVEALNTQINEFMLQKEELKLTREVFIKQSNTLQKQQFESTFFSLLNLHHLIVNSMSCKEYPQNNHIATDGRDCFNVYYTLFKSDYDKAKLQNSSSSEFEVVDHAFKKFYSNHRSNLDHYFKNLYNTIKFIQNSNLEDKSYYVSIVKAQLSNNEIMFLFYNIIVNMENIDFKLLLKECDFFNSLDKVHLIDQGEKHYRFYIE